MFVKILKIFVVMMSAYWGIFSQNLRHKLKKLCPNKNLSVTPLVEIWAS